MHHAKLRLQPQDFIPGTPDDDTLFGTDGDDTIDGGLGADLLSGGSGDDTYLVDRAEDRVVEAAGGGIDTIKATSSYTLPAEVENLTLNGRVLLGRGNALDNLIIVGRGDNNVLQGGDGNDTIQGGTLRDSLEGGNGNDTLLMRSLGQALGGNGDDLLIGRAQVYLLDGGSGNDKLVAHIAFGGEALLMGGAGDDRLTAKDGGGVLRGGTGNDTLTGSSTGWNVELDGGAGNDLVLGNDFLNSFFDLDGDADTLRAGTGGDDLLHANWRHATEDIVWVNDPTQQQTICGNEVLGFDRLDLRLGSGNDYIDNSHTEGFDRLQGGAGQDTLIGGPLSDELTGGRDADTFVLTHVAFAPDRLLDFKSGTDRIDIRQSTLPVGDGDAVIEGAVTVPGPGGFAASAELVIVTRDGEVEDPAGAAAAIGRATEAYAVGQSVIFALDTGALSMVYYFVSADGDAQVEAAELTALAWLWKAPATAIGDYAFSG